MRGKRLNLVLLLAAAAASCETFTEVLGPIPYTAVLTGSAVRPAAVTTDATGQLTAALDQETRIWSYTVGWESLSSAPTSVHLHGPAGTGEVADVLAELNTAETELTPTSAATGTLDLTAPAITPTVSGDSLRKLLNAGSAYVDVHTVNNPDGEIRGQLVRH